jgi:hypothetical protein
VRSSRFLALGLAPLALAPAARAQGAGIPVFSIDWKSPSIAAPDSFTATPMTEGDLLAAQPLFPTFGPLPLPGTVESGGLLSPTGLALATHLGCVGHPPTTPCGVEVDALSHGLDEIVDCNINPGLPPPHWAFSVDYRALGDPASPSPPDVYTEALCAEEFADVYTDIGMPCGPLPPLLPGYGNTQYIDGNGLPDCSGAYWTPGLGLSEVPSGPLPQDNLDALDDDVPDRFLPASTCSYFSLDGGFWDPLLTQFNSGSATANGFQPGDVLMTCPNCAPAVYAAATQLGLDAGGPGTDDLDALVLRENGVAGYQRSTLPLDWATGATDMLFFSVRRGSQIVGSPDAFWGAPIEQGDILVPTGPSGSPPGIWIPAEALGLTTTRSVPGAVGDDVDALDVLHQRQPGSGYCYGDGSGPPCPCANFGATGRGCANSTHTVGALLWANGLPSISFDMVRFGVSGVGNTVTVELLQSFAPIGGLPFGDGLRCLGLPLKTLFKRKALCGNDELGFGVPGDPPVSVLGNVTTPTTVYYQARYRDPVAGFCPPQTFNTTNGYAITWLP